MSHPHFCQMSKTLISHLEVLPSEPTLAVVAVDVGHHVEPGEEESVLGGPAVGVDHIGEEVGTPMPTLRSWMRKLNEELDEELDFFWGGVG